MLLFQHPAALLLLFACAGPSATAEQTATVAAAESSSRPALQTPAGPPELELPRHPALSPDASQVAFSHQGDLWVAPVEGGRAVRLTAHDAYDGRPKWSPDGQSLAFVSNRHGNWDVYTMPVWGGTPNRLTWHSEGERLYQWLDSERLLMGAQRDRRYSRRDRGAWIAYTDGRTPTVMGDWAIMAASVSQDGNTMVYERGHGDPARRAYRGPANSSLWTYDVQSSIHEQITETDGNDLAPMLSPDGKTVYFLSDRSCEGNLEGRDLGLWKMPTKGGRARLVYHPGGRSLRNAALSQNGAEVVAELDLGLVRIATKDGSAQPLPVFGSIDPSDPLVHDRTVSAGASEIAVSPDGESIAFVSAGDVYVMRKHEDIKRCVRVTTHPAPDYSPVWLEDGKELLFVSERDGNAEFYIAEVPDGDDEEEGSDDEEDEDSTPFYMSHDFEIERITQTDADEASPALSPDGKTLAWVVGLGDLVVGDPETAEIRRTLVTGFNAPDFDWSPDSAWLVYSKSDDDFNNDVFLQRVDIEGLEATEPGVQPYNLTVHPDDDTGPRWSPDGRHIVFTSRRMMLDETDVWMVHLRAEDQERNKQERLEAEEDAKKAAKAKKASKAKKLKAGNAAGSGAADPLLSGTWEGTVTGPDPIPPTGLPVILRLLKIGDDLQGEMESMLFSSACEGLAWDASSGTLSFAMSIPDGPNVAVELTISGDDLNGMALVEGEEFPMTGKRTSASSGLEDEDFDMEEESDSDSKGQDDADKDDEEDPADAVIIDWTDLRHRVVRMTLREGNETALGWSADSTKLYFNASTGTRLTNGTSAETGFFSLEVEGGKEDKVESTPVGSLTLADKDLFYVKSGRVVSKGKTYNFSVRYREDLRDVREAVLAEVWRALDRNFYDPEFHGHDWAASLAKWGPAARVASTREDYGEMVNWMLGEMNASHMGYSGFGASAARETDAPGMGLLGVLWDETYVGDGRRVKEVLAGTPAARSISQLLVGDIVLGVNGENYMEGGNWYRLMSGTAGIPTYLTVMNSDNELREVTIRPTSSMDSALYRRFEEVTRARVEEASSGRLGYIHIESMSTGPLVEFERDLFAAGAGKDCLLIDVRENGGGWTTDMILAMLSVRDHALTIPRGGGEGYPQGRRVFATWDKPIVVLCNENSYSNAEIFSWAVKTLGRGPLVGKATFGAVISTGGTGLMDGSFVRLPFRGWYVNDKDHTNMELNGCPVDYPVENLPGDGLQGLDRQLEKAIEVGLKQL
ncbi:MAG: S41 family peptidase [Planctomycetota bacterium]|nr:S41 family peptidase [Planctomycetota bacterium]